MNPSARKKQFTLIGVGALAVVLLITFLATRPAPSIRAEGLVRRAQLLTAQGDMAGAEKSARQAIEIDRGLAMAWRLAADCAVSRNDFDQALSDLSQISQSETGNWTAGRKQAAEILHHRVNRFREAERAYQDVLSVLPDDIIANDGYARLLGLCGRRADAIPFVLRLIRAGEDTDLLILLSRESGTLNDPEMLQAACDSDPMDPNPLLGKAAAAASTQNFESSLGYLKRAARLKGLPDDFAGRLGRQLLANERFDELIDWSRHFTPDSASPESWLVLAELTERSNDNRGAIRCYWEALKLRPESLQANNQLARKLMREGKDDLVTPLTERVKLLNRLQELQRAVIMTSDDPDYSDIAEMVDAYRAVGRLWEAFAWGRLVLKNQPDNDELRKVMRSLPDKILELPLEMTVRESNLALQIDLSEYPVPSFRTNTVHEVAASVSENISFDRQSTEIGFDFQYFAGTEHTTRRMFELTGCGIAVVDFDNDNIPDVYCVQGRTWKSQDSKSDGPNDCLLRNIDGQQFANVADEANILMAKDFGQGVSAGDINNDGFADLYVANIGSNWILLNNGDGTFQVDNSFQKSLNVQSLTQETSTGQWTTSCLIADLNGDEFPDLYDVNYLSSDDLFDRVYIGDHGEKIQCSPDVFDPALDQLWLGNGAGGFVADSDVLTPPPRGKGLGAVAFNPGNNRLSLFVSNDTTANFFYTPSTTKPGAFSESAVRAGLAFNGVGKAEACMGIAVADCTQDGKLDLLVTNFLYESNTLYCQLDGLVFEDRTRDLGLHDPTLKVLGWGTQFLDANLDGRLEAFVINGHTQDLSQYGTPYAMRPQMFEWVDGSFSELTAEQLGEWSLTEAVGRTVARLDWNLDGKTDLAMGLMDGPHNLLTNSSDTEGNRFLTIRLVSTDSARDAIGTTVTATIGDTQFVHQLTAGDGYASCNERRLFIGCGKADEVARLSIVWPSGAMQNFTGVATSQSVVAVEGRKDLAVTWPLIR